MEVSALAFAALVAGTVHVLAGPDHLAAVAPLAIAERRRGWLAGGTWGLGHAAGVSVVAVVAVLLRDLMPPLGLISAWGERLVGVTLVAVGLWALRSALRIDHTSHAHPSIVHSHTHVQRGPAFVRRLGHAHAALVVGLLHGVAGSAHFLGVLPALALPSRFEAMVYVGVFGIASVTTMAVFAAVIGSIANRTNLGSGVVHRALLLAGAGAAIVVGGVWLGGTAG